MAIPSVGSEARAAIVLLPEDIDGLITARQAVEAVEQGYRDWGAQASLNVPCHRTSLTSGVRVCVHQGGAPSAGATGVLAHCEWVVDTAGSQTYKAVHPPVTTLYAADDGRLIAIVVGDATCSELAGDHTLIGLRTAATSVVGTLAMVRPDARTVGILGSGGQARHHLVALNNVRPLDRVFVYSPNESNRATFAAEMTMRLGLPVTPVDSAEVAVRSGEIVLCATSSSVPVFDGAWLEPGQHVTSIVGNVVGSRSDGAPFLGRRDTDDSTDARADVIGLASVEQAYDFSRASGYEPSQPEFTTWERVAELADILAGRRAGRHTAHDITLFKNNAGQGVADVALATLVVRAAVERGLGRRLWA